jgi:hypothetical protein
MGRESNGGHSTKAKGIDRRKNPYKDILNDALTEKQLLEVVRMLHKKATEDFDVAASKILMEYYLGKPTQQMDINTNVESINLINLGNGIDPNEVT